MQSYFFGRQHIPCRQCWSYQFLHAMHFLGFCASPFSFDSVESCMELRFSEDDVIAFLAQRALAFCSPSLPPTSLPRCPRTSPSEWVTGFTYRFWVGRRVGVPAPHLTHCMPPCHRLALTRLCLSNSSIAVELGKRTRTPRTERFCQVHHQFGGNRPGFTHQCVEDIRHLLLECPAYAAIRACPKYAVIFAPSSHVCTPVTPSSSSDGAPFRQSPLWLPVVSGSLLSVLSVPVLAACKLKAMQRVPLFPLRGWGLLQRS